MKFIGNVQAKKDLISRVVVLALLFVVLLFAVIYIISLNLSLGWFSSNSQVEATGMSVATAGDQFDLLVDRTTEYDTLIEGIPKYDNVSDFKYDLSTYEGYSFTANSTSAASSVAYELVNEVSYSESGTDYHFLMPGSCGTMTFYLRPKSATSVIANIDLSVLCYEKVVDGLGYAFDKVDNDDVLNFLKGHILFFEGRTGVGTDNYKYSDLITDNTIIYDTREHIRCAEAGKTDCYEITVYWEWPPLYSEMISEISATAGQKRYPPELASYIEQNRNYFFATNQNSNDIDELDDGYNDADQTLGEHANIIAVSVNVS